MQTPQGQPASTFVIKSVGVDIGSTTSHLTISKLRLAMGGEERRPDFRIVRREPLYRSEVLLTPFKPLPRHWGGGRNGGAEEIDAEQLEAFFSSAYAEGGVSPEDIDTGAVIVTGEAARKDNAQRIVKLFAARSGKFVCATAGPRLEAMLSAFGSGAVATSRDFSTACPLLNIDVGGSTTKFALVAAGEVLETAAMNVGARLVCWGDDDEILRWEHFGSLVAQAVGQKKQAGEILSAAEKAELASAMADSVMDVVRREELSTLTESLMFTPPLGYSGTLGGLVLSGGAAEYFYGRETRQFGDLGPLLAESLRRQLDQSRGMPPLFEPAECLRATVIGASQYTLQVSGSTIFQSRDGLLPQHNVPVLVSRVSEQPITAETIVSPLREKLAQQGLGDGRALALAFQLADRANYQTAQTIARAISGLLRQDMLQANPLVLVFNQDIARSVGEMVAKECDAKHDLITVDEVELKELDYIDIGQAFISPGTFSDHTVVPIVVKSLVFAS